MKNLAFSIPIYKYKVQNWKIKKKKLLDLFNNLQNKVVGNVITSPIDIKTNIINYVQILAFFMIYILIYHFKEI